MWLMCLKWDLRIEDHVALTEAAMLRPVLLLYILEPELRKQPDFSHHHCQFLTECLEKLDLVLETLGQKLIIKVGGVDILQLVHKHHAIQGLWSHQETWSGWTYARDKRVNQWAKVNNMQWHEPTQNGVIRCLKHLDGRAGCWCKQMKNLVLPPPKTLQAVDEISGTLPSVQELEVPDDGCIRSQKGVYHARLKLPQTFLHEPGESYTKAMSSPVTAFEICSRLSVHITFGAPSMREVFWGSEEPNQEIKHILRVRKGKWPSALHSFSGRLCWYCYFIQKLEDEPCIEFENMHPAYDSLRKNDFNVDYFKACKEGKIGYLMVDACMCTLTATGWLNFQMRAMLMSFASYHLWLHWREPALHLARLFKHYEPGIHYSQAQMQSCAIGINSIQIYNPIKQGIGRYLDEAFIREWIPELADMPREYIHAPWKVLPKMNGCSMSIVDEKIVHTEAADKLYGLRKNAGYKEVSNKILNKHGSPKPGLPRTVRRKKMKNKTQGELPL
ncbi:deoxyribodipyrimidine photo-lyase [Rickettsiales bacterium]|nr:deoxyribodipyrimidine photo-lyase [Rickettsiales bacterium]